MRGVRLALLTTSCRAVCCLSPRRHQRWQHQGGRGRDVEEDADTAVPPSPSSYNTRMRLTEDAQEAVGQEEASWRTGTRRPPRPSREMLQELLPDIPHGLPASPTFAVERSGSEEEKKWLTSLLPELQKGARASAYLHDKDTFWQLPAYHALAEVVRRQSYSKSLHMIMEHSFFFLLEREIFLAPDAPLPHVMYEDMQRALSFASLQRPPEEQFQLTTETLVRLLSMAAYHCTLDPHYFTAAEGLLFRRMEQQQHINAEVLSAFVFVCAAAGKVDKALATAEFMSAQRLPFAKRTFAALLHPSLSPVQVLSGVAPHAARGWLLQERLCEQLTHAGFSATALAVHAMFVHYALTMRHAQKWEVVRTALCDLRQSARLADGDAVVAVVSGLELPARTRTLLVETFAKEKGVRCGPETTKAILSMALQSAAASSATLDAAFNAERTAGGDHEPVDASGTSREAAEAVGDALFVLLRTRRNESTAVFASKLALPVTAFTAEEKDAVMATAAGAVGAVRRSRGGGRHMRSRAHQLPHAVPSPSTSSSSTSSSASSSPPFVTAAVDAIPDLVELLLDMGDSEGADENGGAASFAPAPSAARSGSRDGVDRGEREKRRRMDAVAGLQEAQRTAREHTLRQVLGGLAQMAASSRNAPTPRQLSPSSSASAPATPQSAVSSATAAAGKKENESEGAEGPEAVAAIILSRLQYLDSLGARQHQPRGGTAAAEDPLAAQLAHERAQLQQSLQVFLTSSSSDIELGSDGSGLVAGGDDVDTASVGTAASGEVTTAPPRVPAPSATHDMDPEQKAWAAKVIAEEAETALLHRELREGWSRFV